MIEYFINMFTNLIILRLVSTTLAIWNIHCSSSNYSKEYSSIDNSATLAQFTAIYFRSKKTQHSNYLQHFQRGSKLLTRIPIQHMSCPCPLATFCNFRILAFKVCVKGAIKFTPVMVVLLPKRISITIRFSILKLSIFRLSKKDMTFFFFFLFFFNDAEFTKLFSRMSVLKNEWKMIVLPLAIANVTQVKASGSLLLFKCWKS